MFTTNILVSIVASLNKQVYYCTIPHVFIGREICTVFKLGVFLRALRPARTVLRPARLHSALPEFEFLYYYYFFFFLFTKCNFCFCFQTFKNACKIVPRPRFVHVLDCDQILVIRALIYARLRVVRTLNCARILVVRALDCAQFLLHPAFFPT